MPQCLTCKKSFEIPACRTKGKERKYCSPACLHKALAGYSHGSTKVVCKGGTMVMNGYYFIKTESHPRQNATGYIQEHILVAEKALNRYLKPLEVIHHINENRFDNRLENLYLFSTKAKHTRYHKLLLTDKTPRIIKSNLV